MTLPTDAPVMRLDADDPVVLATYEHLTYRAFNPIAKQVLLRRLWQWDDPAERIRTRIPYADQRLYGVPSSGMRPVAGQTLALTSGLSVNVALRAQQCAVFGFTIPPDAPAPVEFLILFSDPADDLRAWFQIVSAVWEDLSSAGYRTGWATTAPKPFPFYRRMGATVHDRRVIDGEDRLLFSLDLTRPPWSTNRR